MYCHSVDVCLRGCLFLPRRVSHRFSLPDVIFSYLRETGFDDTVTLRDFVFDNSMITTFMESWRLETHTFHIPWDECTITLQDVSYHLELCANGESVGGCFNYFHTWYRIGIWELVERLFDTRPPVKHGTQKREIFSLKFT
ncbi:hypothetical protein Ahy_B02g057239 [Arachis hypogaea]|uniref:Aminotransferase-like plant mobile domain-containing protein n=1 Tax=Arachis hypogaea TaxID=3818 RepID=A0A445ABB5_ARAHY|nr:hypothetical protein Ahy_B02g057239 [Arachis hypogaea]